MHTAKSQFSAIARLSRSFRSAVCTPRLRNAGSVLAPNNPATPCAQRKGRATRHRSVHPRQIALHVRAQRKHFHDLQNLLRHRKILREALRHRQRPQIHLLFPDSLDRHACRRTRPVPPPAELDSAQRQRHHVRKFRHAISAFAEVADQRRVRQRASLHAHGLVPAAIKLLQPIELFLADRAIKPQSHGLRYRRSRAAINRESSGNPLYRADATRPHPLQRLCAIHGRVRFGQLNPARQRQIQNQRRHRLPPSRSRCRYFARAPRCKRVILLLYSCIAAGSTLRR